MVMEVTLTSSSMRTKSSTKQMVRMLETVMKMHQRAVRGETQALGLTKSSVGARVLMDSTGVKQWQWRVAAVNFACWVVPQAKAHSQQRVHWLYMWVRVCWMHQQKEAASSNEQGHATGRAFAAG